MTSFAAIDLTIFALGKRERLQRDTRMWHLFGRGPKRSREKFSHGRSGTGAGVRGALRLGEVWIWHW